MIVRSMKHRYFWDVPERNKKHAVLPKTLTRPRECDTDIRKLVLNPISLWGLGIWLRGSQRCHSLHKTHNTKHYSALQNFSFCFRATCLEETVLSPEMSDSDSLLSQDPRYPYFKFTSTHFSFFVLDFCTTSTRAVLSRVSAVCLLNSVP